MTNQTKLQALYGELCGLSVFRGLLDSPLLKAFSAY